MRHPALTTLAVAFIAVAAAAVCVTANAAPAADSGKAARAEPAVSALVLADQAVLRAAPRDSAQQQALLRQGEIVEVRGERLDYLQVWDHQRERGGYVRASQLRRTSLAPEEAPELLAVLRFVKDQPGEETLAIGLAAAWLQAAPATAVQGAGGVEAFDAIGTAADRLALRASTSTGLSKGAEATLAAHLEVASRYGVRFATYDFDGRTRICYDGEALRRVLAMKATPEQQARAALALTRPECMDPQLRARERKATDDWRAQVLDRVETAALPGYLKNRVQMRRAEVQASLAYQRARLGESPASAAQRALAELAAVAKAELPDDDQAAYNDAAMRVGAVRWAALPDAPPAPGAGGLRIATEPGRPGETCVSLFDTKSAKGNDAQPLARRCTYALVWAASASVNREGTAVALAVQPLEAWRELWLFTKQEGAWAITVLPPSSADPGLGYAEFAGWVPGGAQMLLAREARDVHGSGRWRRSFELLRTATLAVERQAPDAESLGAFQRWQDAGWKRQTVAVR